jgi:hypothetical protein
MNDPRRAMLEAIIIIVALGGLEIALWWADHTRQAEQLATLEAIWVELALSNEHRASSHSGAVADTVPARPESRAADVPVAIRQVPTTIAQ